MNEIPLSERVGRDNPYILSPDTAYVQALGGELVYPSSMFADEYQALAAVAGGLGIELPEEVSTKLPTTDTIVDALESRQPCLPMLHVAAEILEGGGPRAARLAAKVIGGAGLIFGELPASLVGRVLGRKNPTAAKVAGGIGNLAAAPGALAKALAERPQERVAGAASTFVRRTYGKHLHQAADLAPYMWATMLSRLIAMENVPDDVLVMLAYRYVSAYSAAPVSFTPARPPSLHSMYKALATPTPPLAHTVRNVARMFRAQEAEARTSRQAALLSKPSRLSKRPSGEALESLHVSSKRYNSLALLPASELHGRLQASVVEVIDARPEPFPDQYEELATAWAAVCERVSLCNSEQEYFADVVSEMYPLVAGRLERYLSTQARQLAKGTASVAVIRLVADGLYPQEGFWPALSISNRLKQALDTAAFNWFDQPLKLYPEGVRLPTREAYVAALLGLSIDDRTIVDRVRAERLAWSVTNKRAERGLCKGVIAMVCDANEWLKEH